MKRIIVTAMSCIALVGCATRATEIAPAYVSTVGYQALTCDQLALEAQSLSARAAEAAGLQNRKANNDAAAMAVGLIVFWPALFFMKGDGAQASEVARMKGEMQAIEQTSIRNNCGIAFPKPEPVKRTTIAKADK